MAEPSETPNLTGADLANSDLSTINLRGARLAGANLASTSLSAADLRDSVLASADLSGADLRKANLSGADLTRANLAWAVLGDTDLTDATLLGARRLETTIHLSKSHLDHKLLLRSPGIPSHFLRGCGLDETEIALYTGQPPEEIVGKGDLASCFLSYATPDHTLAHLLYLSLANRGVNIWMASRNLRLGDSFQADIFQQIRSRERFIVIVSAAAERSRWVQEEVEFALAEAKRRQAPRMILPVTIARRPRAHSAAVWIHRLHNSYQGFTLRRWQDPQALDPLVTSLLDVIRLG